MTCTLYTSPETSICKLILPSRNNKPACIEENIYIYNNYYTETPVTN